MVLTWQNSDRTKAPSLARGNFSLDAGGLVSLLLALAVVSLGPRGVAGAAGILADTPDCSCSARVGGLDSDQGLGQGLGLGCHRYQCRQDHGDAAEAQEKTPVELDTAWAVVEWNSPNCLVQTQGPLRSGSQVVELGSFLTSEEKRQLARYLKVQSKNTAP